MTAIPSTNLIFREIPYDSAAYRETVTLRDAVLRRPLGLTFTDEQLEAEKTDYHLACYRHGKLLGCLVLVPMIDRTIKMRQVAIAPEAQKQGIGTALVEFSEEFARQRHFTRMILHARETAVPFYEKLGYRCEGERFEEVSLPHWKMQKNLTE